MNKCTFATVPGCLSLPSALSAQRVRELRLAAGMTQEDLAERCGLFRTYLSRIETGRANPTLTMIHALADQPGRRGAGVLRCHRPAERTQCPNVAAVARPGLALKHGISPRVSSVRVR